MDSGDTLIVVCALGQKGFHKQTSRRLFVVKNYTETYHHHDSLSQAEFILRLPPSPDSHAGTLRTTGQPYQHTSIVEVSTFTAINSYCYIITKGCLLMKNFVFFFYCTTKGKMKRRCLFLFCSRLL